MNPTNEPADPWEDAERRLPVAELSSLPLQFRVIWEKSLQSREALQDTLVNNAALRSRHVARGCHTPISKIVDVGDE